MAKFRPGWHAPLIPATPNDSARVSQGPRGAPLSPLHRAAPHPAPGEPSPTCPAAFVRPSLPLSHLSRGGGSPDGRPGAAGAARGRPERPPQERGAPAPPPRRRHAAAAAARGGGHRHGTGLPPSRGRWGAAARAALHAGGCSPLPSGGDGAQPALRLS